MHDHGNETLKVVALTPICCKSHKHTCKSLRASLEPAKDLNRESPSKKLECNRAWKEFGRETSLPTDDTSLFLSGNQEFFRESIHGVPKQQKVTVTPLQRKQAFFNISCCFDGSTICHPEFIPGHWCLCFMLDGFDGSQTIQRVWQN